MGGGNPADSIGDAIGLGITAGVGLGVLGLVMKGTENLTKSMGNQKTQKPIKVTTKKKTQKKRSSKTKRKGGRS